MGVVFMFVFGSGSCRVGGDGTGSDGGIGEVGSGDGVGVDGELGPDDGVGVVMIGVWVCGVYEMPWVGSSGEVNGSGEGTKLCCV